MIHAPLTQPQAARDKDGQHQSDTRSTLVGVYLPRTPSSCPPDRYMDREDARYQLAIGGAESINRGKAIRLVPAQRRDIEQNEQRGYSCRPGTGLHDPGARNLFLELQAQREGAKA